MGTADDKRSAVPKMRPVSAPAIAHQRLYTRALKLSCAEVATSPTTRMADICNADCRAGLYEPSAATQSKEYMSSKATLSSAPYAVGGYGRGIRTDVPLTRSQSAPRLRPEQADELLQRLRAPKQPARSAAQMLELCGF